MTSSFWTRALLALMIAFIGWAAWLMGTLAGERTRDGDAGSVTAKVEALEQALTEMREASASTADISQPDSELNRWRALYMNYRRRVNEIDAKSPLVQRVWDSLVQVYAFVTRTERIRQVLLRGGQGTAESRMLEAEFRSDLNLALAAAKEARLKLRYPPDRLPAGQRNVIFLCLGAACLLTLAAGLLLILTDRRIAAGRRLEKTLQQAEARAHAIEDSIQEGVLVLDDAGAVRSANAAIERMFGYEAEDLAGKPLRELIPWARGAFPLGLAEELLGRRRDGSEFPLELGMKRVPDGNGSLLLAFVRDVSFRRRGLGRSERLDLAAALAGRFAHNFNNILTSITGYADLLLYGTEESDPVHKDIEEIKKAGERASFLTAQMLAASGKQVLRAEDFDLNALAQKVAHTLPPLLGAGFFVRTKLEPRLDKAKADPAQIERVLLSLALNARDAMPDGGEVVFQTGNAEVERDGPLKVPGLAAGVYAFLEVRDAGRGMNEEIQRHLFEPFFTTKTAGRGLGLGLAAAWGIIRQSGGTIVVESTPGHGSSFRVYLPAERAAPPPDPLLAMLRPVTSRRRA